MPASVDPTQTIYKIVDAEQWREAERTGTFRGAEVDFADGFIHFSTAEQVRETAAKHFAGRTDLLLIAVDGAKLTAAPDNALRYEPSRGGALFPHLYTPLVLDAVLWARPLPLDESGAHTFPEGL